MISNGMGIHGSKEHCLDIAKTLQNFQDGQKKRAVKTCLLYTSDAADEV